MKGLVRDIVLIISFIITFLTSNQMISQHYNIILMFTFFPFVLGGFILISIAQNDYAHFKEMFEHRIKQNGTGSYTIFFITCVCVLVCCVSIINFSVMVYQIIFVLYFIATAYFLVKLSSLLKK